MRIGIDARMLGSRNGGLGRYVQELVTHLASLDDEHIYVLFLKKENIGLLDLPEDRFEKVLADIHWYGFAEQTAFPKIIKKAKVDLMHFPHWNVPLFYNKPFVVTIHDLLLLHYPTRRASTLGPLKYWFKQFAYKCVLNHAAEKARHILVPTQFVASDVQNTLGVPAKKVSVTYEAPMSADKSEKDESILQRFDITKPYVLYVGVAYPHKNLEGLVKTWQRVEEKTDEYQLVLVGKKNYFYERLLETDTYNSCENIVYTDYVDDETLGSLYAGARAYAFPSLHEGFGLPPLEAMSRGIPVVSSNHTCLPEVLGDAALFIDPENHHQFADALLQVLEDDDIRHELMQNAKKQLSLFSWNRLAKQTQSIYEKNR